eukprot:TRINITY_DN21432_c0_g1_i1.p1 TRINITY_DN21432_c0_g1~~TRINITY_DN21432_c0_g1_i1.p1  ORF type:complete len:101 (+),score=17.51 TRINITY_DN21432_c0_g1_i1:360-662(+)
MNPRPRYFQGTWTNDNGKTGAIVIQFTYHDHRGLTRVYVDNVVGTGTCMDFGDGIWGVSLFVGGYWYALKWQGNTLIGEYGKQEEQRRGTVNVTKVADFY